MYKKWKKCGSRAAYNLAKQRVKEAVYAAKQEASRAEFSEIYYNSNKVTKQMKKDNRDVTGEKCLNETHR